MQTECFTVARPQALDTENISEETVTMCSTESSKQLTIKQVIEVEAITDESEVYPTGNIQPQ